MSRLSIEISSEQHQKIKALAALEGKSIEDFILSKLFSERSGDEVTAMAELEKILLARINEAKNSEPITQSFMEIVEECIKE